MTLLSGSLGLTLQPGSWETLTSLFQVHLFVYLSWCPLNLTSALTARDCQVQILWQGGDGSIEKRRELKDETRTTLFSVGSRTSGGTFFRILSWTMSGCSRAHRTQGPAPKLKPANWGPSWSPRRDFLSDQAFMARAGISSSLGSLEKLQFAHLSSG